MAPTLLGSRFPTNFANAASVDRDGDRYRHEASRGRSGDPAVPQSEVVFLNAHTVILTDTSFGAITEGVRDSPRPKEGEMRIAVIGGRYKNEAQLARIARNAGYELEFEEGHMWGRGMDGIRSSIARSQLVVIVTDVNSHGAVHLAKKVARQLDRPMLIIQNFGAARLTRLLDALEQRRHRADDHVQLASGIAL